MKRNDFEYLIKLLKQNAGWDFDDGKYFIVDKKMYNLVRERGYTNVEDLIADLKSGNKTLLWQAVESLAMSDTSFYRDYDVFKNFEAMILPYVKDTNRSTKRFRIWSLGCSSGQEAYSVAMAIRDKGSLFEGWKIEIVGTDISTNSVAKAQKGIYSQFEIQMGLNAKSIIDNFSSIEGGMWQAKKELMNMVEFRRYNVLEELAFAERFDVIFCRNVLRFFDKEAQRRIIEKIYNHQVSSGFLILGVGEKIEGIEDFYEPINGVRCIYKSRKAALKNHNPLKDPVKTDEMPSFVRPDI